MSMLPVYSKFWAVIAKSDAKRIASQIPTPGVTTVADIPYVDDGTREHLMDVYYPRGAKKPLPVIIDIHGGGWMYGYKEINKNYNLFLASSGYTVFSINYRLVPQVRMHRQIRDVFMAFKQIEQIMDEYPCDREKVFLTGDSAGGQLAAYAAAIQNSEVLREAYNVQENGLDFKAVCLVCPVCDMLSGGVVGSYCKSMLESGYEKKPYGKYLSLESLLKVSKLPPTFLISSSGDVIAKKQTKSAAMVIEASGTPYKFMYWKRSNGKLLKHVFPVIEPTQTESVKATDSMLTFFDRYSTPQESV